MRKTIVGWIMHHQTISENANNGQWIRVFSKKWIQVQIVNPSQDQGVRSQGQGQVQESAICQAVEFGSS